MAAMDEFLIRAGHIAYARMQLDYALTSLADGETARGRQQLLEAAAETFRALGYDTVEQFLEAERRNKSATS